MHFLVELYLSRPKDIYGVDARARAAAEELAREGAPIRHVRSTIVPDDEMCLLVFEAPNRELALEATRRAELVSERIVEAIETVQ